MKAEDKYHKDWLLKKDAALIEEESVSLDLFLKENPQELVEWQTLEAQIDGLNKANITFSDGFEFKVMDRWKRENEQLFDQPSKMILYAGIAAAVLLIVNINHFLSISDNERIKLDFIFSFPIIIRKIV